MPLDPIAGAEAARVAIEETRRRAERGERLKEEAERAAARVRAMGKVYVNSVLQAVNGLSQALLQIENV